MGAEGLPDLNDIVKAAEATTGLLGEIRQFVSLTPEDAADRVESRKTRRMLRDAKRIRKHAEELKLGEDDMKDLIADAARRHGCTFNYEKCVSYAAPRIDDPEKVRNVDPEWADKHREHAEKAYDEETQQLWGRVLAGEINAPGSFSKRSMSILADMEQEDARAFEKLCARCIGGKLGNGQYQEPMPMLINVGEEFAITPQEMAALNSIGLTNFSMQGISQGATMHPGDGQLVRLGGADYLLQGAQGVIFSFTVHEFTKYGVELSKLCQMGCEPGFGGTLIGKWIEAGITVNLVTHWNDENSVEFVRLG